MPTSLKRKSTTPELSLDALFDDINPAAGQPISQVKKRSPKTRRLSRTPTRVVAGELTTSDSVEELLGETTSNQKNKQRDREKQLQVLCDGLSDKENNVPFRFPAPCPGNQVTPSKGSERQEYDLDALIDGIDWDEEIVLTPVKTTKMTPKTPKRMSSSLVKVIQSPLLGKLPVSRIPKSPLKDISTHSYDLEYLCDGMENWSEGLTSEDELKPKSSRADKSTFFSPKEQVRDSCTRCVVLKVMETRNAGRLEKVLDVQDDNGSIQRKVILKDDWAYSDVSPGDVVNLIGEYAFSYSKIQPTMTISSTRNLIILHPDLLIPATYVSEAPRCIRKPILSSMIKSPLDVTPSTVFGNMLHEVMQSCLASAEWGNAFIEEKITHTVRSSLDRLMRVNVGIEEARVEMRIRARGLAEFSKQFIADKPKPDAFVTERRSTASAPARIALTGLHDVEETIWSPTYGLKGVVDASMQAHVIEEEKLWPVDRSWTLPLEIKTGRSTAELAHRAQTILYTLLMSERYGVQVPAGLLYYTHSKEILRVSAARNEVRGLMVARNEMASYMVRRSNHVKPKRQEVSIESLGTEVAKPFLPETINDDWTCSKCYAVDSCMLYRKAIDRVVDESSPIAEIYQRKTGHLTAKHLEFFRHWESLISLEESDLNRFRRELWTMTAEARQMSGRCFANMVISGYRVVPLEETEYLTESQRHIYEFVRPRRAAEDGEPDASLLDGFMSVNDAVSVSVEPNLLAFARGFIIMLQPACVTVALDREINPGIVERGLTEEQRQKRSLEGVVYRIDRDELSTSMNRIRDNLAQLFYEKGDTKRRSLIVDLAPPVFDQLRIPADADLPSGLNESQLAAIRKVMSAKDYALILGMPGTGKTTTIAELIKSYVEQGKSVLLTSYTHSAVDTILLKLVETDIQVLRLGNVDKVHPDVRHYSVSEYNKATSIEQLEQQLLVPPVVATTCLSTDHSLFSRRKFDVCIVDEASQITLPTCMGPLRFADTFVLVGDHYQLPPLVRNMEARKRGLENSLFRILCDAHPEATVDLVHQYRMNEDIMVLCNTLIYNNRLRCGSDRVAKQALVIHDRSFVEGLHEISGSCTSDICWLSEVLDERRKVIFLDTDNLPAEESRVGDLVQNEVESSLTYQIAETMFASGIAETQVGIISLYRQQNKLLSLALSQHPDVEVMTVDRSQGRDKDCIIMSMVRSNEQGNTGDLLKDWRRINVALTRARSKLIIIGSRRTLRAEPLLSKFLSLVDGKGWILQLPKGAHTFHNNCGDSSNKTKITRKQSHEPSTCNKVGALLKGRGLLRDVINGLC